jgi:hypothetical protein
MENAPLKQVGNQRIHLVGSVTLGRFSWPYEDFKVGATYIKITFNHLPNVWLNYPTIKIDEVMV